MSPSPHHVKSTAKTFAIIEQLERGGAGITALSQQTGIGKSSVYKYLDTLRELGFVTKVDGRYHLSLRFYQLGRHVRDQHDIFPIARPKLDMLAEETGETVSLIVEETGDSVYVYQTRVDDDPVGPVEEGGRLPIHVSTAGKAILAYQPESEVDKILGEHGDFDNWSGLKNGLKRIRNQRIVTEQNSPDQDKYSAGLLDGHRHVVGQEYSDEAIYSIAVPIRNGDGYSIAAIEVNGHVSSFYGDRLEEDIAALLVTVGKSIETELL